MFALNCGLFYFHKTIEEKIIMNYKTELNGRNGRLCGIVFFSLFFLVLILFSLEMVSAADHTVIGNDFEDIKDTIDLSGDNDRILLGNKTYVGSGSYIRVDDKRNLTIQGSSDSERATLDARHLGRIFIVNENSTVTFCFVDFINGDCGPHGGAAISAYNTIVVENCSFRNNWGESGGAIFIRPGADNCTIANSSFINNEGRYSGDDEFVEGGGIDTHANYTTIIDCVFRGNTALTTGGAVNFGSNTVGHRLIGSIFTNNHAPIGGALRSINNDLLIENCFFDNNYANETSGGALYLRLSDTTIKDCVFTNNHAANNGGAIYDITGNLNIINTSFTNNQAVNGGAVHTDSQLKVINSNFTNNQANTGNIAGIYSVDAVLICDNNFKNNMGIAITLSGDGTRISGNNFTGNTEHAVRSSNLKNAVINNNSFVNNGGTGLYITGNGNKVYSNVFNGNNIGAVINSNNTNFTSNVIGNSKSDGVRLTGNNIKFVSNNITSNKGHGLALNGNSPIISNNVF